jgi:hypothetical protein
MRTIDLTDPKYRELCGQLIDGSRLDYGCFLNPSLVLLFNQNLSPNTHVIGVLLTQVTDSLEYETLDPSPQITNMLH